MEKTVDFQLTQKLQYTDEREGDFQETATIIMHHPDMTVFDEFSALSQLCMRAISDVQNRRGQISEEEIKKAREMLDRKEDNPMEPSEIKMMLLSSESVEFKDVSNAFKRLACKVCYVSETIKIKSPLFDKMDINDFTNMICAYIANFITPSLL